MGGAGKKYETLVIATGPRRRWHRQDVPANGRLHVSWWVWQGVCCYNPIHYRQRGSNINPQDLNGFQNWKDELSSVAPAFPDYPRQRFPVI